MWRIVRQAILGKWQNVRQVPSATSNQATDPKEGSFSCFEATSPFINCLRNLGIQPSQGRPEFHHHHRSTHHQHYWEKLGYQRLKPCLVDTLTWLGTSFILGMRIQRYFLSDKDSSQPSPHTTLLKVKQCISDAIDYISCDLTASSLHALQNKGSRQLEVSGSINSQVDDESLERVEQVVTSFAGLLENQLGVDAASRCEESEAFTHFQQATASLNCPRAHYNLGICYETGRGTSVNLHMAAQHYHKAARGGHASALYNLGMFYLQGVGGLECSQARALACIHKAAKMLLPEALLYMGVHFHERNKSAKAVWYFSQAAEQNSAEAMFYLGLCYHHGWGVALDTSQARRYFTAASSGGHVDAARWLALHQSSRPLHISFSASDLQAQDGVVTKRNVPSAYLDVVVSPAALCAAQ